MSQDPPVVESSVPEAPAKKGLNLKIVVPVLLLIGIVGAFTFSYLQTKGSLEAAVADSLESSSMSYRLTNLSLLPPSADLVLTLNLNNPSAYDLDYMIDIGIFSGSTLVAPTSGSLHLSAGGMGVMEFTPIHFGSDMAGLYGDSAQTSVQGTVTVVAKVWGIVPVSYSVTSTDFALSG